MGQTEACVTNVKHQQYPESTVALLCLFGYRFSPATGYIVESTQNPDRRLKEHASLQIGKRKRSKRRSLKS